MATGRSGRGIVVVGAGSWGTALAITLARAGRRVTLVARDEPTAAAIASTRVNARYLPDAPLPDGVDVTTDPETCAGADLVLLAVPSQEMRQAAQRLAPVVGDAVVVSAAKGLERGSLLRMTEVLCQELPAAVGDRVCALSGPNLAAEIAAGRPAATVVAGPDAAAELARGRLMGPQFRCYTNGDVVGVEIGGALKNVIALGAGIGDGLAAGDNAKAAFLTRGIAEIARLGVAVGADPLTFAGLTGLGDLVATCASPLSRNRRVGQELAGGRPLADILAGMGQVAEGVATTEAARELGRRAGVELPITDQMYAVLFEGRDPLAAVASLMRRDAKDELHGLRGIGRGAR